jgi:hypothetical protein
MKTRIYTRALARSVGSVAAMFRNHTRVVAVALVISLLLAAVFSAPHAESAGATYLTPPQAGDPTNLVVTATTNTSISLSWAVPPGGAAHYRVERSENMSGPFVFVANSTATTFNDTTVTALRAYLYRVIAVTSAGCPSQPTNEALGTAISFEFSQLLSQPIKARHLYDVRTAINAVRALANLPAATWARPTLNGLEIKATDVQELRNRLDQALATLDISVTAYQDPLLSTGSSGTPVKAIHVEQLQTRSTRGVRTTVTPSEVSTEVVPGGKFDPPIALPLVPVHLSVLPDGRILFWGRDMDVGPDGRALEIGQRSEAYVWNKADGSNETELAVFRPSEQNWYILNPSTGAIRVSQWGIPGDRPVPGDYDGDGRGDLAIYRPSNNLWGIKNSSDGAEIPIGFGLPSDIRVQADYDRDGKTDVAVFRASEGRWLIRASSDQLIKEVLWGQTGDIPVPGDYDRDRKVDIAVFRPKDGTWYIRKSSNESPLIEPWGINGDLPAPADYNGDGTTDLAVYRPSDGNFYIKNIVAEPVQTQVISVGQSASAEVAPGDYDGDGKADAAIFQLSEGTWQIRNSSNGDLQSRTWGLNGDMPVAKDYDGMLRVANSTTNLFCSGHSFLPDGRLLVAGGHQRPEVERAGERHLNIFDYRTNCWTRGPDMKRGRWYPYNVTLSTGETLILSGTYWSNDPVTTPRTFAPNLDAEVYSGGPTLKYLPTPDPNITMYPYLHLTPEGKVLQVQSGFINPLDSSTLSKESRMFDPAANLGSGKWDPLESTIFPHALGTAVLFDSGNKVLVMGGFDTGTNATRGAEFMDLTPKPGPSPTPAPTWRRVAPMNFPRAYHTATILPDGKVLVTGGVECNGLDVSCGKVLNAEMWDPLENTTCPSLVPWRTMAAQTEVRAYHSIAALLPDGKVLVGGGGLPGAVGERDLNGRLIEDIREDHARLFGHKSVEIYSPPYLFDANGKELARPQITSAPATVSYGQSFEVVTLGVTGTPKVSLVRLASVTHGFNQDQRQLFLNASVIDSRTIDVTAPADPKICPPGYYMLFVLSNGVPSIAKIVRVQQGQTHSLFPTEVPQAVAGAQGQTWEQGVEFSSSVAGQITHIRFWKAPGEPAGNHVGRIWTTTGILLAAAAFPCESPSGWQEVQLPTPVQITAGVRYRVTYNLRNEGAKTFNVLDSPITRGPLTAWRSVFSSPEGSFPTSVTGSNLFADFVFKTGQ